MAAKLKTEKIKRSAASGAREKLPRRLRKETSVFEKMGASIGVIDSGVCDLGHNPKYMARFGRD